MLKSTQDDWPLRSPLEVGGSTHKASSKTAPHSFYPAHFKKCLDSLMRLIRQREGIPILLGDQDTRKSLLCHLLLKRFSSHDDVELLHIPYPDFRSTTQFLTALSTAFGGIEIDPETSVLTQREVLIERLYYCCEATEKTLLIVVEEAHVMASWGFKLLEDLHSFRPESSKKIQIVIFGQKQLRKKIGSNKLFKDYLGKSLVLKPLSFFQTKALVAARLEESRAEGRYLPEFSYPAYLLIHLISRGYQGKTTDLCDLIWLTWEIQDRSDFDWLKDHHSRIKWMLVYLCGKMIFQKDTKKLLQTTIASTCLILTSLLAGLSWNFNLKPEVNLSSPPIAQAAQALRQPAIHHEESNRLETRVEQATLEAEPQQMVAALSVHTAQQEKPILPSPLGPQLASKSPEPITPQELAEPAPPTPSPDETGSDALPAAGEQANGVAQSQKPENIRKQQDIDTQAPNPLLTSEETPKPVITEPPHPGAQPIRTARDLKLSPPTVDMSPPDFLGTITVFRQETLGDMIRKIYGPHSFNQANTSAVMAVNNNLPNAHSLRIGDVVRFPVIPIEFTSEEAKAWRIQLLDMDNLQNSYRYLRIYENRLAPLLIVPYFNQGKARFSLMLQEHFNAKQDALASLDRLRQENFPNAQLLAGLKKNRFFYAERAFNKPQQKIIAAKNTLPAKELKMSPSGAPPFTPPSNPGKPWDGSTYLGKIETRGGETLGEMIRNIYGPYSFNSTNTEHIIACNPQIKNHHRIAVGDVIHFPALSVSIDAQAEKRWWLELEVKETLAEAYRYLRVHMNKPYPLLIIPAKNSADNLRFHILLQNCFTGDEGAKGTLAKLDSSIFPRAEVFYGSDRARFFQTVK